ncbi:hypothetical protein Plec18167_005764 [Paecilomyces lecythidis]|uniref:Uncharacterized protein n=1 Tax=Paecilomyces lecythidis TaxID=3004212 RepID=A0ABR3XGL5_9EURO
MSELQNTDGGVLVEKKSNTCESKSLKRKSCSDDDSDSSDHEEEGHSTDFENLDEYRK